jgi:hypothetical protein
MKKIICIIFILSSQIAYSQNLVLPDSMITSKLNSQLEFEKNQEKQIFFYDNDENLIRNEFYNINELSGEWIMVYYFEWKYDNYLLLEEKTFLHLNDYPNFHLTEHYIYEYSATGDLTRKIYKSFNQNLSEPDTIIRIYDYKYDNLFNLIEQKLFDFKRHIHVEYNDTLNKFDTITIETSIVLHKIDYYYNNYQLDSLCVSRPDHTEIWEKYSKQVFEYEGDSIYSKIDYSLVEDNWRTGLYEKNWITNNRVTKKEIYDGYPVWRLDKQHEYYYENNNLIEYKLINASDEKTDLWRKFEYNEYNQLLTVKWGYSNLNNSFNYYYSDDIVNSFSPSNHGYDFINQLDDDYSNDYRFDFSSHFGELLNYYLWKMSNENRKFKYYYPGIILKTKNFDLQNIEIFPNPTTDWLNIVSEEKFNNFHIYNMFGELVHSGVVIGHKIKVELKTGNYILILKNVNGIAKHKLTIIN